MRFQSAYSVDHIYAGVSEFSRPVDVPRFVKSRFEFDDDRYMFSILCGQAKCFYDFAGFASAIERLLDGNNRRVGGGSLDKLNDGFIGLVRVIQQSVASADGLEYAFRAREFRRRLSGPVGVF